MRRKIDINFRIADRSERRFHLLGNFPVELGDLFYDPLCGAKARFFIFGIISAHRENLFDHREKAFPLAAVLNGAGAEKPFRIHPYPVARQTGNLLDTRNRADLVKVFFLQAVFARIPLHDEKDVLIPFLG